MLTNRYLSKNSRVLVNWLSHFLQTDRLELSDLGNGNLSRVFRFVSNKRYLHLSGNGMICQWGVSDIYYLGVRWRPVKLPKGVAKFFPTLVVALARSIRG